MAICPTLKISAPNRASGFVIINESDFDPETMVLYDGNKPEKLSTDKGQAEGARKPAPKSTRKRVSAQKQGV